MQASMGYLSRISSPSLGNSSRMNPPSTGFFVDDQLLVLSQFIRDEALEDQFSTPSQFVLLNESRQPCQTPAGHTQPCTQRCRTRTHILHFWDLCDPGIGVEGVLCAWLCGNDNSERSLRALSFFGRPSCSCLYTVLLLALLLYGYITIAA
jgi:hypothetical protein